MFRDISELVDGPVRAVLYGLAAFTFAPLVISVASLTTAVLGVGSAFIRFGVSAAPLAYRAITTVAGGALRRVSRFGAMKGALLDARM